MTAAFDRAFWERRWSEVLRERGDQISQRPPSRHLVDAATPLPAGAALDAGCGHGSETLWLASRGWSVTAVDFSGAALAHGRSTAEAIGAQVAERVDWVEGDLADWTPTPSRYDLVVCLYVHVAGSVADLVRRMGSAVAPGGTLLMVGHRPIDPATGAETPAAGQNQVSVEAAVSALDGHRWTLLTAEDRTRPAADTGVDAVVVARRTG